MTLTAVSSAIRVFFDAPLYMGAAFLKKDRYALFISMYPIYCSNVFNCPYYHNIMSTLSM
jgi:hypothetical protein